MSGAIKRLAGQTAIYGVSSIVGRLLNYLLVPLYTHQFLTHEYGVIVEMYSYVAFLIVILTYGMETAFFRFYQNDTQSKNIIFSTSLISVFSTSMVFIALSMLFRQEIAQWLQYPNNSNYVVWFGIIVGIDALIAIPFARLRAENKPLKFAFIKLSGIAVNIGLVLFFVLFCPWVIENEIGGIHPLIEKIYHPEIGVGYVFISNLIATLVTLAMLLPIMMRNTLVFDKLLWRKMFFYALPLLVAGLAGIINEALDKILLKHLLPQDIALSHIGIYGACAKIAVLMALFIQAFRFAAEPFFFAEFKKENAKQLYAKVMKIFVFGCIFIFLGIMFFMDIVQHFVGKDYREGLEVVPILLMAHIFLGVYFNLSIWYKLTGQTHYGAYIAIIGALITILLNIWLIPHYGYYASAWIHLVAYISMTVISWLWGQKYFPVNYDYTSLLFIFILGLAFYFGHSLLPDMPNIFKWSLNIILLMVFAVVVALMDKDFRETLKSFKSVRKKSEI